MNKEEGANSDNEGDQLLIGEEQMKEVNIISIFKPRTKLESEDEVEEDTINKLKIMLTCPICMEILQDPVYIKACSHRFCKICIEKAIRMCGKKCCPTCRKQIQTKRQLRIDDNVQAIIGMIFGNVSQFRLEVEESDQKYLNEKYQGLYSNSNARRKKHRGVQAQVPSKEDENAEGDASG